MPMTSGPEFSTAAVAGIVFLASVVRSTFGFGDALVGMPLLALVLPLTTATPLMAFVGPTIGAILLIRGWKHLDLRSAGVLILSTLAGIPLGLLLLKSMENRAVKIVLAAIILLSALTGLLRPGLLRLRGGRAAPVFGFAAGILGAAFNINGPPVAFFGALRGWPPQEFRATLQGYFLPTGAAILLAQGAAGLWKIQVFKLFALSLPALAAGAWIGGLLARRIPAEKFRLWVYGLIFAAGLVLLIRNL
jgi:hypothetical protein